MGVVYLGRRRTSEGEHTAAVKTITPDLAGHPNGVAYARFRREVGLLIGAEIPGIASGRGADLSADPPWVALEHVPGPDLGAVVSSSGMPR